MLRWTVHLKGLLPQVQGSTAVAVGQKVFSFLGSYDSNDVEHSFQVEVHVFNTVTLRWTKLPPATTGLGGGERPLEVPSSMCRGHSSAVAIEEVIYVWGRSWRTDYYDAIYAYDVAAHRWHKPKVTGTVPEARDRHSSCVLGRVLYIYGGYTRWTGRTDNIYRLDTSSMVWSLVGARGTPPPVSEVQSATVIGTKMFVFGGRGGGGGGAGQGGARGGGYYNNIRVFDTETDCWLSNARPSDPGTPPEEAVVPSEVRQLQLLPGEREGHSAFAYNGELYILGGGEEKKKGASPFHSDDLWKFNPESFSWTKAEPKGSASGPRWQTYGMCSCVVGGARVVLFGGGASPDDLYILDLSPSLKTLCKLALIRDGRGGGAGVPHCIRWELTAMLTDGKRRTNTVC